MWHAACRGLPLPEWEKGLVHEDHEAARTGTKYSPYASSNLSKAEEKVENIMRINLHLQVWKRAQHAAPLHIRVHRRASAVVVDFVFILVVSESLRSLWLADSLVIRCAFL